MCREIWGWNRKELYHMFDCVKHYRFIAVDTEFPGSSRQTCKDASEEERYDDIKFSVDKTKLIQLGFTFFDGEGRIGGTWEVNFSDFSEIDDARNEKSIEFLKRNGLDLGRIREEGIGLDDFFTEFRQILSRTTDVTWVTFHGYSDMAYLLKYITSEFLPATSERFAKAVARVFGSVYDLKVIAARHLGLTSRVGLESLAQELRLDRVGSAHHAGSDSELTARVFPKMVQIGHNVQESQGLVYGLGYRIVSDGSRKEFVMMHQIHIPRVMVTRCYGLPPPPFLPPPPHLRPMFADGFQPFGGFVYVPRVAMY